MASIKTNTNTLTQAKSVIAPIASMYDKSTNDINSALNSLDYRIRLQLAFPLSQIKLQINNQKNKVNNIVSSLNSINNVYQTAEQVLQKSIDKLVTGEGGLFSKSETTNNSTANTLENDKKIDEMMDKVADRFASFGSEFKSILDSLPEKEEEEEEQSWWDAGLEWAGGLWDDGCKAVGDIWDSGVDFVGDIWDSGAEIVGDIGSWLDDIGSGIGGVIDGLADGFIGTMATIGNGTMGLVQGIANFGEGIVDGTVMTLGGATSYVAGLFSEDAKTDIQDWTASFVETDYVTMAYDWFYETDFGKAMNDNSIIKRGDDVYNLLTMGGEIASQIAINFVPGGIFIGPLVDSIYGMGNGSEKAFQQGATFDEAFQYGMANAILEAVTNAAFGKITQGLGNSLLSTTSPLTTLFKYSTASGAVTASRPWIDSLLIKGTYRQDVSLEQIWQEEGTVMQSVMGGLMGMGATFASGSKSVWNTNKGIKEVDINQSFAKNKKWDVDKDVFDKVKEYKNLLEIKNSADYQEYIELGNKGQVQQLKAEYYDLDNKVLKLQTELDDVLDNKTLNNLLQGKTYLELQVELDNKVKELKRLMEKGKLESSNSSQIYEQMQVVNSDIRSLLKTQNCFPEHLKVNKVRDLFDNAKDLQKELNRLRQIEQLDDYKLYQKNREAGHALVYNPEFHNLQKNIKKLQAQIDDCIYGIENAPLLYKQQVDFNDSHLDFTEGGNIESFYYYNNLAGDFGVDQGLFKKMCRYERDGKLYSNYEAQTMTNNSLRNDEVPLLFKRHEAPEYTRLKNKLMNEGFSENDAMVLMASVDNYGACSYATVCNEIFYKFKDHPKLFEELFGYPMHKYVDGVRKLNSEELLLDLFTFANKTENGGKLITGNKFNKEMLSTKVDANGNRLLNTKNQVFMSRFYNKNNDVINSFLNSKNKNFKYSQVDVISNYFSEESGQNIDFKELSYKLQNYMNEGNTLELDIFADENHVIEMIYDGPYSTGDNVRTDNWSEGGGHSVAITAIYNDYFQVSSWGNCYNILFQDLINGGKFTIHVSEYKFDV